MARQKLLAMHSSQRSERGHHGHYHGRWHGDGGQCQFVGLSAVTSPFHPQIANAGTTIRLPAKQWDLLPRSLSVGQQGSFSMVSTVQLALPA